MFFSHSQIEKKEIFGEQLVDEISLSEQTLNQLFAALLLTTLGVFFAANLLLLEPTVLADSARITLACFAILLIFYMISRQIGNLLWGLVLTYGLMWLLVYSRVVWLVPVIYGVAVIAALYALRSLLTLHHIDFKTAFLMATVATVTILGVDAYTSFDMLPRLYAGNVHQDTLFHASIASMIKNYGVSSTGLHGLVETPYHTLSHVLMGAVSLLSHKGVVEVYGVANWVLFAPLLIFSITVFCAMLDRSSRLALPLLWGVTSVLLTVMPFLFRRWSVWNSFFVSESYLVSLGLFLLGSGLLYKRCLSIGDLLLVFLLTAMMATAKVSVGLVFAGLWLARFLFIRRVTISQDLAALILAVMAAGLVVFDSIQGQSGGISFDPLHFVRYYSFLGDQLTLAGGAILAGTDVSGITILRAVVAVMSFFFFHFILSWSVTGLIGFHNGIMALIKHPLSLYSLSSVAAGILIIAAVAIPGGAVYYFSSVALFVSLPGVVVLLAGWVNQKNINNPRFLFFALCIICILSGGNGFYQKSILNHQYSSHMQNSFIDKLVGLRNALPKHIVLKADADALTSNPVKRCSAKPFVYPAVSERPWIDVILAGCSYKYYGYRQYGLSETQQKITVPPVLLPGMEIKNYIQ
ncbi:MAG: hypothetical protein D3921_07270 [Candidatus Electrothrix sp. AW1]|nr:hypothetical protein [Candidatus Electrothrix sp. AX1]MCI5182304.1 hypothetical protein [Candidatus Electrothrix gigas]